MRRPFFADGRGEGQPADDAQCRPCAGAEIGAAERAARLAVGSGAALLRREGRLPEGRLRAGEGGMKRRRKGRRLVEVGEQRSQTEGAEAYGADVAAHAGHGLVEMRRSEAVVDGAVGLDEGGQIVAGLDELAVLGIEAVVVAAGLEIGEAVRLLNALIGAEGVVEFRLGGEAEIVVEAFPDVAVAFLFQRIENLAVQFLVFVLMDDFRQLGHGALARRDDVAGEQFGEIVEQAAVEIVDTALGAAVEVEAEQIGIHGHDEHVSQH